MPSPAAPSTPMAPITAVSQASEIAMANAELAAAASIALVMFNAAQAEQGCQQIELSVVGIVCQQIIAAIAL